MIGTRVYHVMLPLPARVAKEPGFVAGIHEPKNQRYSEAADPKPYSFQKATYLSTSRGTHFNYRTNGQKQSLGMTSWYELSGWLWAIFHPNCFSYDCTMSSSMKTEHQQVWLLWETSPKIIGYSHLHGELGRSPMIGWLNQTINTPDIQSSRANYNNS